MTKIQDQMLRTKTPLQVIDNLRSYGNRVRREWADHGPVNNKEPISQKEVWITGKMLLGAPIHTDVPWPDAWNAVYFTAFGFPYVEAKVS